MGSCSLQVFWTSLFTCSSMLPEAYLVSTKDEKLSLLAVFKQVPQEYLVKGSTRQKSTSKVAC